MGFNGLLVKEIFTSVQGETSQTGLPFIFIRLSGCNLRCTYCDTAYAFKGGDRLSIPEVLEQVSEFKDIKRVLLTGGEPLIQRGAVPLADALVREGYELSIETHGEVSIEKMADRARIVMDIKTPSSGMCREGFWGNLRYLKKSDEVKFVIASQSDYSWSKKVIGSGRIPTREILFSPALRTEPSGGTSNFHPGEFEAVSPQWLAEKVIDDALPVRLQIQLHKILWPEKNAGV